LANEWIQPSNTQSTCLRGLVALALGLAVAVGGRSTARLVTLLALFWMTGGLLSPLRPHVHMDVPQAR
jgi:hypothetical protein